MLLDSLFAWCLMTQSGGGGGRRKKRKNCFQVLKKSHKKLIKREGVNAILLLSCAYFLALRSNWSILKLQSALYVHFQQITEKHEKINSKENCTIIFLIYITLFHFWESEWYSMTVHWFRNGENRSAAPFALKTDSRRKIICHTVESKQHQYRTWFFSLTP